MKYKAIIAAAALAASSVANAITDPFPGGSSLVLTAFDNTSSFLLNDGVTTETAARGIVVDLGVDFNGFLANPAAAFSSFSLGTLWNDTFFNVTDADGDLAASDVNNIRWNITAAIDTGLPSQLQLLTSIATGNTPVATNNQVSNAIVQLGDLFGAADTVGAAPGNPIGSTSAAASNPASNYSTNFDNQVGFNNTVGLGETISLFALGITTQFVFGQEQIVPGNAASVSNPFDAQYTLFADGSFAPVPIPGAVWLFGAGLFGLVGVARRRRNAA